MDDLIPLEYDKNTNKKPSGDLENVITHLKKGNDAQALKHCNAIIDSHPNLPKNLEQAYFYKGLILHKRGDLDAAEDCYRQSIVLNADNPSSLHCLASILKNKKQLLNAEKFWKQCLALEAKFTEASIGLATLYLESKKNDLAYSHLMTVLKSQPQNSQAKEMLQQAFNLTERIRQLESRVKQDLDNRDLYDELALMYAFTENVPQAIRAFKLAIKNQHSGDANVFNYFGALAFTNRSPEEDVTAIYKKGIESHLDEWSLYNNLAYCLIKYGRYEEAQKMLKKAIHLGPQESMPYFNLGFFYYHTHQYEEAFKVEKKCLALDPHNLKALSLFINSAQHMADWKTVDEYSPKLIQLVGHHIKNKIKLAYYPTPFLLLTLPISNDGLSINYAIPKIGAH